MPITSLLMTLGSVLFDQFEVPEIIESLGGTQAIAEHRFPGGTITQQRFGAYPSLLRWRGLLTGSNALFRMRELDRLRVAGEEVSFNYGDTFLLGLVVLFEASPRSQWLVPYRIEYAPRLDFSATDQQLSDILSTYQMITQALFNLETILSVIIPTGNGPTHSALDTSVVQYYAALPPTLQLPLQTFITDTSTALLNSLNIPSDISFNDAQRIYSDAQALLAVATPLSQSSDPTLASPAQDTISYVSTITTAVANPSTQNVTIIQAINPNLLRVAAQYYGDHTKWQVIADASGISPPDPQPVGQFALVIPTLTHG